MYYKPVPIKTNYTNRPTKAHIIYSALQHLVPLPAGWQHLILILPTIQFRMVSQSQSKWVRLMHIVLN
jgi:hypothetical protein